MPTISTLSWQKGSEKPSLLLSLRAQPCDKLLTRVAFAPITYQENWEIIRRIQEEEGVEYTL
jgi:hypothetical protein